MSERDPRRAALDYLNTQHVMTLATRHAEDIWAAAVFYVAAGFDLYFLSAGHTRHATHLHHNRRAAGTIQASYSEWTEIKGLQFEGDVTLLADDAQEAAIALYTQRFPFVGTAPPQIANAMRRVNWYRLSPTRLYYIDNTVRFGHRDEIQL